MNCTGAEEFPKIQSASDHSLLVTFGRGIARDLHRSVARLCRALEAGAAGEFLNLHPAYSSVLVSFDPRTTPRGAAEKEVARCLDGLDSIVLPDPERVEIPVCYAAECGPDLEDVAAHTGLAVEDVVRLHSSVEYLVYFLGFAPGFPYLGELPQKLAVPRLPVPRTRVPRGSVAIGGGQTGIYPIASPGGWRVIGRTALALFTPEAERPTLLRMGDLVRFAPISEEEFHRMARSG